MEAVVTDAKKKNGQLNRNKISLPSALEVSAYEKEKKTIC